MRGIFVAIEGIDRSGKSTLAGELGRLLRAMKYPVENTSYPKRTNLTGALLDAVLRGKARISKKAVHLLFSANRWEEDGRVRALLGRDKPAACDENSHAEEKKPQIVLSDRYSASGVAYSMANGISRDFALASEEGLVAPDLVVFLDVSPEVVSKREGFGGEIYEELGFQWKVYAAMKEIVKASSPRVPSLFISQGTPEEVCEAALKRILEVTGARSPAPHDI